MIIIIDKILWGMASILIVYSGFYYTFKLNFIQFRIRNIINSLKIKDKNINGISPYQTLAISLGAKIGVGSLAGIALAIYKGGVGSLFWLWITAFISAPNAFSESLLGVIFREKDQKDIYKGGPSYYIDKGLNKKNLAKIYGILIIISYIFGFLSIQSNTITKSITEVININPIIVGLAITLISLLCIIKGIRVIASVSSKLVPIMCLIYIFSALIILFINIHLIPSILYQIISDAFNIKSFGWGVISSMIIGIQRGIFSNEAGIGTAAIVAATANNNFPVKQGLIQMLGIYFTTLIICTATAMIILTSNYTSLNIIDLNGIEITQYAINYHLGEVGEYVLIISIILFAFSTIITGYYYGESSLKFLFKNCKHQYITILKIITLAILLLSSIISPTILWQVVDVFVAILAIVNIYAMLSLKDVIIEEWKFYKFKKYDKIK
jgi:AGCS family alanine or glycine:cation symporter